MARIRARKGHRRQPMPVIVLDRLTPGYHLVSEAGDPLIVIFDAKRKVTPDREEFPSWAWAVPCHRKADVQCGREDAQEVPHWHPFPTVDGSGRLSDKREILVREGGESSFATCMRHFNNLERLRRNVTKNGAPHVAGQITEAHLMRWTSVIRSRYETSGAAA